MLAAIAAYVLAVGPQPSVIRAGVAGALASLAWLTRPAERALVLAARRGDRAARLESVERARSRLPALVRRGRSRSSRSCRASGVCSRAIRFRHCLPHCVAVSAACGIATAPISLAPLPRDPAADGAGERRRGAGRRADARARARLGARCPRVGPLRRLARRLVCRLSRRCARASSAACRARRSARRGRRGARRGCAPRRGLCLAAWRTS